MGVYKLSEVQPNTDEAARLTEQALGSNQYGKVDKAFEERQVKLERDFAPSVALLEDDTGSKAARVDLRFKAFTEEGNYRALFHRFTHHGLLGWQGEKTNRQLKSSNATETLASRIWTKAKLIFSSSYAHAA